MTVMSSALEEIKTANTFCSSSTVRLWGLIFCKPFRLLTGGGCSCGTWAYCVPLLYLLRWNHLSISSKAFCLCIFSKFSFSEQPLGQQQGEFSVVVLFSFSPSYLIRCSLKPWKCISVQERNWFQEALSFLTRGVGSGGHIWESGGNVLFSVAVPPTLALRRLEGVCFNWPVVSSNRAAFSSCAHVLEQCLEQCIEKHLSKYLSKETEI